ncbi:MAG: hypothetical protein ACTTJC_07095 [Campylobacter sp.]
MVKAIRAGINRPSYEKMCQIKEKDGIEFEFWKDVRSWFDMQKQKEKLSEQEAKTAKKAKK